MTSEQQSFDERMARIETLVQRIEQSSDAAARETTREIVSSLLELHGAGLRKLFELLSKSAAAGQGALDACAQDDLVRSLLLLHDLHPEPLDVRVGQALDDVRPLLHSHGGDVELLGIDAGRVRLQMRGSCDGCPSSSATLRDTIEQAMYRFAPDAAAIEVEGVAGSDDSQPPAGLVSLQLPPTNGHATHEHSFAAQET